MPNLIDLYIQAQGYCETPEQWFRWAMISGIAACVADRVKIKRPERLINPNLYVFLIGPSGSGKESAISGIIQRTCQWPLVNTYAGQATSAALVDWLARMDEEGNIINEKLFFVTEELACSVINKDMGKMLTKFMTSVYGGMNVPIKQGTRMYGHKEIKDACFNWLAGSTEDWLKEAVDRVDILSGFWARVVGVRGRRQYERRIPKITKPENIDEIEEEITRRMIDLTYNIPYGTVLHFSPDAEDLQHWWYLNRQIPIEEAVLPTFNRTDASLYKLSGILKLAEFDLRCDTETTNIIQVHHVQQAIDMLQVIFDDIGHFIRLANANITTQNYDTIKIFLERSVEVSRKDVINFISTRGITKRQLDEILALLMEQDTLTEVRAKITTGFQVYYQWKEPREPEN